MFDFYKPDEFTYFFKIFELNWSFYVFIRDGLWK